MTPSDEDFLKVAIEEADLAFAEDEVPIGAVIVVKSEDAGTELVVARAHNLCESRNDPTAHAEMLAIRAACDAVGAGRLDRATLYSTIEPCAMCAGAILHARIERVVFGASDAKFGAAGSIVDLLTQADLAGPKFNHVVSVTRGVLLDACRDRMQRFFRVKRMAESAARLSTPKTGR
ncbi:MAG: nucleoside deaminase [Planctomycetes bacterium]|nr:nucleoside deaminase [Planctomycetota bacterium]